MMNIRNEKTSITMSTTVAAVLTAICISLLSTPAASANILLYPFSLCTNSHLFNFEKMAALLASSGHEVTMLVSDKYSRSPVARATKDQVQLLVYNTTEAAAPICEFETLDEFLQTPIMHIIQTFFSSTYTACDSLLGSTALLHRLKQEHYDLVIYEALEQCSKILADYIDVPFIIFHTSGVENIYPRHPGYLPSLLTTYCNAMTLYQRVLNTLGYMVEKGIQYRNYWRYQQLRLEHGLNTTLAVSESFNRASLRFVLGDFGLDYIRPMQPSHVLLGGYVQSPPASTWQQLQKYLDGSGPNGVVVLSFGQMVRQYGPEWRHLFASALAGLPYRVIWRYNETRPVNLGSNTLLVPWFNQLDVLRHPKVRVFVTHCGLNSAFETSYSGVPVVAVPLFADQFYQATKLTQHAGMGIQLDIRSLTSDSLRRTIVQVASSPVYRAHAQQVSNIMNKKPLSQRETILHWVDYIVDTKGAKHLHSMESHLTWYQYLLIDVILVLFLPCGLILMVLGLGARLLLMMLCYCRHRRSKVAWYWWCLGLEQDCSWWCCVAVAIGVQNSATESKGRHYKLPWIGGDLAPGYKEGIFVVAYRVMDRMKLCTRTA